MSGRVPTLAGLAARISVVICATVSTAAVPGFGPFPAAAGAPFNPRPTIAYDCGPLIASRGPDRVWVGRFSGRKETNWDFKPYETARVTYCFTDEKNCRNWLYNMMSEYDDMIWFDECRFGAG